MNPSFTLLPYRSCAASLLIVVSAPAALTFNAAVPLQPPAGGSDVGIPSPATYYGPIVSVSAAYGTVGYSTFPVAGGNSGSYAARWSSNGASTRLGDLPAQTSNGSTGYGINNLGQACGWASVYISSSVGYVGRAVRWGADGSATALATLTGQGNGSSSAVGINNVGQVVGSANANGGTYATRWASDGTATLLGFVSGPSTSSSYANSVNDTGMAVGYANLSSGSRAVRWAADGSATRLGDVAGQTTAFSLARDVNATGQAVGFADINSSFHAVRWAANGTATLLGDFAGQATRDSEAYGITDTGYVAGYINSVNGLSRAAIWDVAGNATALQDLMNDGNTWTFSQARSIDENATTIRVLAYGSKDGGTTSGWYFVTAAVPEPSALFGLAAPMALLRRRKVSLLEMDRKVRRLQGQQQL